MRSVRYTIMRWLAARDPYLVVGLVGAVLGLGSAATVVGVRVLTADPGRIIGPVTIAGVPVTGLRSHEASWLVKRYAPALESEIELVDPDGTARGVPVAALDPKPEVGRAVVAALAPRSLIDRVMVDLGRGERRELPLRYRLERRPLRNLVANAVARVERSPRAATLAVADGRIVQRRARSGRRVQRGLLVARIRRLPPRAEVPVISIAPAVSDAAARRARALARRITATPVVVFAAGLEARLDRRTLLRALRFVPNGAAIAVRLDRGVLRRRLSPRFDRPIRPPRSARFAVAGRRVRVIPGRAGRVLDAESLARSIARAPGTRRLPARFRPERPVLTTTEAHRMRIREPIAQFTTRYSCCEPRVTNIRLGAGILDGQVIRPGARFSLNQALGERTSARGFVPAPQINAGELEDAVGGGVSQIATTFFNAAFFAGLRVITHTPHQFYISRYPAGREATVSWGGPELIVQNDWPAGVLIRAVATDTAITVRLYSLGLGRRVETATGPQSSAAAAFSVEHTRRVYRGDRLRRDERYRWTYGSPPPR